MPVSMPMLPYNFPDYDPFWDVAEETGVPVSFHVFTVGPTGQDRTGRISGGPGQDLATEIVGYGPRDESTHTTCGLGALERHPDLKFVLVEGGGGVACVGATDT